jgi:putative peptide zinc metalloprotease protein
MPTYLSLRSGCAFYPFHNGASDREYIARAPDGRQFKISGSAYTLLKDLDQGMSVEEIYQQLPPQEPSLTYEEFHNFLVHHYWSLLIGYSDQGPVADIQKKSFLKILISCTLIPKHWVGRVSRACMWLYAPAASVVFGVAIVVAHLALYGWYTPDSWPHIHLFTVFLACMLSVLVHEFGHASAVVRFKGTPGSIGAGLYILMPVLYADVSHVWTFRTWQRIVVDLGGVYFQQIVFMFFAMGALYNHDPSLRAACIGIDVMTVIAINPVFRFDGYWILVDWLGVPNLHKAAGRYLKGVVASIATRQWQRIEEPQLKASNLKATVFTLYALAANLLLGVAVVLNLRWIRFTVQGILQQAPVLFGETLKALRAHAWLHTLDLATGAILLSASGFTLLVALGFRGKQIVTALLDRHKRYKERKQHEVLVNVARLQ